MCFLSMIGSAIGAVGSFISGAVSTVGSVCSGIGGTIMSGVKSLGTGLLNCMKIDEHPGLFTMVQQLAGMLGLPAEDRPEELGMKVEQSRENPDDFESIEAYIDHLQKDIQADNEKWDKLSDADKLAYGVVGTALYVKGMEQKSGMDMSAGFLKSASEAVSHGKLSEEGVKNTLESMKERGVKNAGSFSDYMEGKAGPEEHMIVYDSLKEALHKEFPDLSNAELNAKVTHIKDFVQQAKS